jgi:hypothetical protein
LPLALPILISVVAFACARCAIDLLTFHAVVSSRSSSGPLQNELHARVAMGEVDDGCDGTGRAGLETQLSDADSQHGVAHFGHLVRTGHSGGDRQALDVETFLLLQAQALGELEVPPASDIQKHNTE